MTSYPTDWKVYRNGEYGFELRYPKEWEFRNYQRTHSSSIFNIAFFRYKNGVISYDEELSISIGKRLALENLSCSRDDYIQEHVKLACSRISFADVTGYKTIVTYDKYGVKSNTTFCFNKDSYGWFIVYPNTDFQGNHDVIYDQILSSFRFTR